MSKPKFTPGPWRITGKFLIRAAEGVGNFRGSIVARSKMPRSYENVSDPEAQANAALISKTPDMYALLNEIDEADFVTTYDDEGKYCNLCDGDMYRDYDHGKDCLYTRIQSILKEINKT